MITYKVLSPVQLLTKKRVLFELHQPFYSTCSTTSELLKTAKNINSVLNSYIFEIVRDHTGVMETLMENTAVFGLYRFVFFWN